ncbi:MAG TPA: type II toxin-antitoxin system HicB family antitoxin [Tepidisphaeraceae bacterium]|nr:type II toxin-antitoxin system HicB family antitoxin [Tepidisphaeraceae bacterium]
MKQTYHTIIRPARKGYVGWVEEVPGAITQGTSLEECRQNLKDALTLLLETHRDEARRALDESCIEGNIEVDLGDHRPDDKHTTSSYRPAHSIA